MSRASVEHRDAYLEYVRYVGWRQGPDVFTQTQVCQYDRECTQRNDFRHSECGNSVVPP